MIALGDISSLAESVKPAEGEHTFESPQEGVVVAYGRDRHEDGVDTKHFDTLEDFLREKGERFNLSARAYDRIVKVARTIADLAGEESISPTHLAEAIGYRTLDRGSWGR